MLKKLNFNEINENWDEYKSHLKNAGVSSHTWAVNNDYFNKGHEHYFLNVCRLLNIEHVPVVEENVELTPELIEKYSIELKKINGKPFEGVVIKHSKGSFKVMNKYYDMNK